MSGQSKEKCKNKLYNYMILCHNLGMDISAENRIKIMPPMLNEKPKSKEDYTWRQLRTGGLHLVRTKRNMLRLRGDIAGKSTGNG
jgi:hypothetical protein